MSLEKILQGTSDKTSITSVDVIYIIQMIKKIQARMKDPDNVKLEYMEIYDKLSREFSYFSDNYGEIFTKVIRGDSLKTIAQILYFRDKVSRGLIKESELSEKLASIFLPKELLHNK